MTHEELLAKIENGYLSVTDENSYYKSALRAVVELHEPYGDIMCVLCEGISYPCSTIQAIEKELK